MGERRGREPRFSVHIILFLICTSLLLAAGKTCLRTTSIRPELMLIALTSLYLAYPVKNLALAFLKDDFITFDFYRPASTFIYIHFIVFTAVAWLALSRTAAHPSLSSAQTPEGTGTDIAGDPRLELRILAMILLVANSLFLFWTVYQITNGQLTTLLFTSDARKAFLLNQQGQGWISLLIFFAFPLTALQKRSSIRNPLMIGCILITFLTLSAIGSRLFLFGYVICIIIRFYRITPTIAVIMFFSFVLFGALIYMSFAGSASENSFFYGIIYFMRTFDGADLMNGYLETMRPIYYGVTIAQEIFLTYIPRALWDAKPFNFGSIVITSDMYPELQDVQTLGATYPPGMLLEGFANFGIFFPIFHYIVVRFLLALSSKKKHASPYIYALYVSGAAISATLFRGFGPFLVSLTAFSMILVIMFLLVLPFRFTIARHNMQTGQDTASGY